ncbi:WD40 repeat-like protein [Rhizopogon vinicolor AM-OR11-026]|uniref:WD40 repeat-like protein n=1 Tax=Rhizopogon vinicolor AM-OR11-026 TaxID=1314800 RepID=A0A1B7MRX5_9AGAM|nr:WD40 repeat-like protein [Rhizopogon vinicolor AM-OR11-026]
MRGHSDWVRDVIHLPDVWRIITCSNDGSLRLWDLKSGTQIGDDWRDGDKKTAVITISLSPNGKTVASGSDDGIVRLWDVNTGKVISTWIGYTSQVRSLCWGPDGKRVVSGHLDGTAGVWNAENGKTVINPIKTGQMAVYAMAYSPDGTKIATGGYGNEIKIWDSTTGEHLLGSPQIEHSSVRCLAWTSDGKKLISGKRSGSIKIFDTTTWEEIATLKGHRELVTAITLSSNNRLLASASWDNTVRLWDLDKNISVCLPFQHENDVNCAAFSADGTRLVTGCDNNNAYVWNIDDILQVAGLQNLLPDASEANKSSSQEAEKSPSQGAGESFLEADATGGDLGDVHQTPQGFFDVTQDHVHSSPMRGAQHRLSARYRLGTLASTITSRSNSLFGHVSSLVRRSQPNTDETTENSPRIPPLTITPPPGPVSTTVRSRILHVSNWWPMHAGHAHPPIVDVPFAQGYERNAAAGAPKGKGGYIRDEDFDPPNPPPPPNPSSLQPSATVQITTGVHGGGRLCCF